MLDCWPIQPESTITEFQRIMSMHMICHDQEPLSKNTASFFHRQPSFVKDGITYYPDANVPTSSFKIHLGAVNSVYDEVLLVHSERNSDPVQHLSDLGCRPVYYWSHAVIAQDWYRFAQHDPELRYDPDRFTKDFLIYNRAWLGTREYRLRFAEMLVENNLHPVCAMRFNPIDSDQHYQKHYYQNPVFRVNTDLERYYELNTSEAHVSADYHSQDYGAAGMEVVLETLFDDSRNHLTEKSLRPLACGKPFLLVSTPGSLAYLRSYGFETFGDLVDESYDTVQDPVLRLQRVIEVMQHIKNLDADNKRQLWQQLHQRARRNQQRFFSEDFFYQVIGEFTHNFRQAVAQTQKHRSGIFTQQWLAAHSVCPLSVAESGAVSNLIKVPSQSAGGGVC